MDLFEKCGQCNGTRKLVREVATGRAVDAPQPLCPKCFGQLTYTKIHPTVDGLPPIRETGPCPECCEQDGKVKVKMPRRIPEVLPVGFSCPFCSTGYHEIGITSAQLRKVYEERDRLLDFVARVHEQTEKGVELVEVQPGTATVFNCVRAEMVEEAKELVKGKESRIDEYRIRKGLPTLRPYGPSARPS